MPWRGVGQAPANRCRTLTGPMRMRAGQGAARALPCIATPGSRTRSRCESGTPVPRRAAAGSGPRGYRKLGPGHAEHSAMDAIAVEPLIESSPEVARIIVLLNDSSGAAASAGSNSIRAGSGTAGVRRTWAERFDSGRRRRQARSACAACGGRRCAPCRRGRGRRHDWGGRVRARGHRNRPRCPAARHTQPLRERPGRSARRDRGGGGDRGRGQLDRWMWAK